MSFAILDVKDNEVAPLPLLLVDITLPSGVVLHYTSRKSPTLVYNGNTYVPRLLDSQISAQAILSQEGIASTPAVALKIEDSDKIVYTGAEAPGGFKGATVNAFFVFYDPILDAYSIDSYTKFVGLSNPPSADDGSLKLTAESKMKMSLYGLPTTRISRTCPNIFPQTLAQRQDAADNPFSIYYRCGYSADATGANACGNLFSGLASVPKGTSGGIAATTCDKTKAACIANGMYSSDLSGDPTGRFSGIQWAPVGTYYVRPYGGKWEQLFNQDNQAKYNDFVPLCYGLVFIDPAPVLDVAPDGNYTHSEVLLNDGKVWDIQLVLVNDEQLPHTFNDTRISTPPGVTSTAAALLIGFWEAVNDGGRNGLACTDNMYNGQGDPMGNLGVIETVPINNIAGSGSAATVQVLAKCGAVRVYTTPTAFTLQYSNNPAWVLMDMLVRGAWDYSELDIASFIAAAAIYDTSISYTTISGGTSTHAAYACNIVIRARRSLMDVCQGVLNACGSYFTQDWQAGGLLQLWHEGTIVSDQPAPIPGSNDNTPIPGLALDSTTSVGYSAYLFDETTILREGGKTTLTLAQAPSSQTPNTLSVQFWNEENRYSQDIATLADTEDMARMWPQTASAPLDGCTNYDQIYRALARMTAKGYRGNGRNDIVGNPIGDVGGTLAFKWKTTFRGIHLRVGRIVTLSSKHYGFTRQLYRITNIEPSVDFRVLTITAQFHNDIWYLWTFGQQNQPAYSSPFRNASQRTPYIWQSNWISFPANDSMYPGLYSFRAIISYLDAADSSAVPYVETYGWAPLNALTTAQPPYVPIQGTTASTGGSIPGGLTVYVAFSVRGTGILPSSGLSPGPLSQICAIGIPAGTSTNTATVPLQFSTSSGSLDVYAGFSPNTLSLQAQAIGAFPSSWTLTAVSQSGSNPPDALADHIQFYYKRVNVPGVWLAQVASVTSTTIAIALPSGVSFTTNQWAGYDLSAYALQAGYDAPLCNLRIASNTTGGVLTLAGGTPDPTTDVAGASGPAGLQGGGNGALAAGDWVVMRPLPAVGTDSTGNYVEDLNFANAFNSAGLVAHAYKGQVLRIIAGTGAGTKCSILDNTTTKVYISGSWPITPDATSRFIIEDSSWTRSAFSSPVKNADSLGISQSTIDLPNVAGQAYLIAGVTEEADGTTDAPIDYSPMREILIVGAPGNGAQNGILLTVSGTLAIDADVAPIISVPAPFTPGSIELQVKNAPSGGAIGVLIRLGSSMTGTTILLPSGATSAFATSTEVASIGTIPPNTNIHIDITGVGTTSPGTDLSVLIFP